MTKEAFKERANWGKFLIKKVGVLDVDLDPALWKVMPPQLSLLDYHVLHLHYVHPQMAWLGYFLSSW